MAGNNERCATRALALYPRVKGTSSAPNVAATGLSCAASLDKKHEKRAELLTRAREARRAKSSTNEKIVISDDDRSGLYIALIEAARCRGRRRGSGAAQARVVGVPRRRGRAREDAGAAHRLRLASPERVPRARHAGEGDPDARAVGARFPGRLQPARAPRARVQGDEGVRQGARRVGPRAGAGCTARARSPCSPCAPTSTSAKGDTKAAKETIAQAVEFAKSLPEGQRSEGRIAGAGEAFGVDAVT